MTRDIKESSLWVVLKAVLIIFIGKWGWSFVCCPCTSSSPCLSRSVQFINIPQQIFNTTHKLEPSYRTLVNIHQYTVTYTIYCIPSVSFWILHQRGLHYLTEMDTMDLGHLMCFPISFFQDHRQLASYGKAFNRYHWKILCNWTIPKVSYL